MSDPHSESIQSHASGAAGVTSDLPHHGHGGKAALPFSEADWKDFHESDKGAGAAIIVEMAGIFTIGLVLYTVVAIIVGG